jgi:hypothetical protein
LFFHRIGSNPTFAALAHGINVKPEGVLARYLAALLD